MTDDRVQYKFMIPAGLKDRLEASAHDNRRSLSAEIIDRLELSLSNKEPSPAFIAEYEERFNQLQDMMRDLLSEQQSRNEAIEAMLADYLERADLPPSESQEVRKKLDLMRKSKPSPKGKK